MHTADNLTTFMCRLSWNLGASTFWNPQGLSRPVMGLLLYDMCFDHIHSVLLIWFVFCYEYCLCNQNYGGLKQLLFHLCTQGSATCYSVLWLKLSEASCKSDTLSFTLKVGHNINNYFACMHHVSVASAVVYSIVSLIHFPEVRTHETVWNCHLW